VTSVLQGELGADRLLDQEIVGAKLESRPVVKLQAQRWP
jgi:hypothetical protein